MRLDTPPASRDRFEYSNWWQIKELNRMAALISIGDFQSLYNVSRSTVYRLQANGAIKFVHIGRSVRIPRESAESWFASLISGGANDQ